MPGFGIVFWLKPGSQVVLSAVLLPGWQLGFPLGADELPLPQAHAAPRRNDNVFFTWKLRINNDALARRESWTRPIGSTDARNCEVRRAAAMPSEQSGRLRGLQTGPDRR